MEASARAKASMRAPVTAGPLLVSGWLALTQPREITTYGKTFGELAEIAVRGAQARALITAAIDALG